MHEYLEYLDKECYNYHTITICLACHNEIDLQAAILFQFLL